MIVVNESRVGRTAMQDNFKVQFPSCRYCTLIAFVSLLPYYSRCMACTYRKLPSCIYRLQTSAVSGFWFAVADSEAFTDSHDMEFILTLAAWHYYHYHHHYHHHMVVDCLLKAHAPCKT